jgi:hypothetical protein
MKKIRKIKRKRTILKMAKDRNIDMSDVPRNSTVKEVAEIYLRRLFEKLSD